MQLLAHSARNLDNKTHGYVDHVCEGLAMLDQLQQKLSPYFSQDTLQHVFSITKTAYIVHDLGKLDPVCQHILYGKYNGKQRIFMPNHVDAGVAVLLDTDEYSYGRTIAALAVHAHHRGFQEDALIHSPIPSFRDTQKVGSRCKLLIGTKEALETQEARTNRFKSAYTQYTEKTFGPLEQLDGIGKLNGLVVRLILSLLVAVDHHSTSQFYMGDVKLPEEKPLEAQKTLSIVQDRLDVKFGVDTRNLRTAVRKAAEAAEVHRWGSIHSAVGSGKTEAGIIYALRQAIKYNTRRILCVSPLVNLTNQTFGRMKEYLNFDGEDRVAEIDYLAFDMKEYTEEEKFLDSMDKFGIQRVREYRWEQPIISTTAVSFFKILASHHPRNLKHLHKIAGSTIILDEFHSTVRPQMYPIILYQLQSLVEYFGCTVLFMSGSPTDPWKYKPIQDEIKTKFGFDFLNVYDVIPNDIVEETFDLRVRATSIPYSRKQHTLLELVENFRNVLKPHVFVASTVRNAAVIAESVKRAFPGLEVLYLSTALTPIDRSRALNKIRFNLESKKENWVLISTTCINTGLDFSFRSGAMENIGVPYAVQLSGRVNRNIEFDHSMLQIFEVKKNEPFLNLNPSLKVPANFLRSNCKKYVDVNPGLLLAAFQYEFDHSDPDDTDALLMIHEQEERYATVGRRFNVIQDDGKVTALVKEKELPADTPLEVLDNYLVQVRDTSYVKESEKFPGYLVWNADYHPHYGAVIFPEGF